MSKYDDARAMREARYGASPDPDRRPGVVRPGAGGSAADLPAEASAGAVPNLAPIGVCASCDKRRAALKVSLKRYRTRGAKV